MKGQDSVREFGRDEPGFGFNVTDVIRVFVSPISLAKNLIQYRPRGESHQLRSKVVGVYDKGKAGSVVETQQDIVDKATGESYARAVGSAFFIGQGNWGGPKGPATENFPSPQGKKPDAVVSHQTTAESALLYRYVNFNAL